MNNFNSTIKRKTCKCGCSKYPTLSCFGYYFACMPEHLAKKAGTRRKVAQKNKNRRNSIMLKAKKYQKDLNGDTELDLWFRMQMQVNDKYCQNCGKSLYHYNDNDWRGSQHHIVDKSPLNGCPSIATHPLNHLVLGKWCCHSQWHTSFENAAKMPVFPKAQEKFLLFQKFIAEDELRRVNPLLFQTQSTNPTGATKHE